MPIAATVSPLVPAALLCLYLVAAPNMRFFPRIDMYDERRLLELFTLLLIGVACTLRYRSATTALTVPSRAWRLAAAFVVACGVASALLAPFPREALLEVALLVMLALATTACAAGAAQDRRAFRRLASTALSAGAALAIAAFLAHLAAAVAAERMPTAAELFPGFTTPRFLGQLQTWSLPLIALPLTYDGVSRRSIRTLVGVIAAGWWMLAFATGTRGTLFGVGVGFLATAALVRPLPGRWLATQGRLCAAGAAAYLLAFVAATGDLSGLSAGMGHLGSTADSGRLVLWRAAVELIGGAPLLGVGPHHFGYYAAQPSAHPHDAFLQIASEWGLPAALTALACVGVAALAWRRGLHTPGAAAADPESHGVRSALTAALAAAAVHASLSGLIVMPISQIAGALVIGWAWGESGHSASSIAFATPRSWGRGNTRNLAGWSLLALVVLVVLAMPDLCADRLRDEGRSRLTQTHFRPRMWKQGASNFSLTRAQAGRLPTASE